METVTVNLGSRSYPIMIGGGLLAQTGSLLCERGLHSRRLAIVTDSLVGKLYGEKVVSSLLASQVDPLVIEIPAGEEQKNLTSLAFLYDKFIEGRLDRRSPILALGGGVVGDLAGFAAATFQRGVPFVQIPTTLLAQVDASVGGKTAIDHPAGKNLIGAFYQPKLVVIDVSTLNTLSERELRAGLAEVIKYGVILSPDLFRLLEKQIEGLLQRDIELLTKIISICCQLKARVVEADETESDRRAILNFGHTLGHAIESASGYTRYLHGEAVAIGMVFAMSLSQRRGLCSAALKERVVRLLKTVGLPLEVEPDLSVQQLLAGMTTDKKMVEGKVKFVCVEELGKTRFEHIAVQEVSTYF
ncbi:MAG: 3-dehydroquinate synthase [Candidatus Binatia bacterium]